jgi:lipopolysaccharide/colanic/teichoic acid biosynthesis glycosyltransferase
VEAADTNDDLTAWARRAPDTIGHLLEKRRPFLAFKRLTDIVVAAVALILFVPIQAIVAMAILLDSGSPILYRTRRIGKDGQTFTMYKFRTMVQNAEECLPQMQHLNVAEGMVKIPNDPRVTRVGTWLRRFSLDELPQLWNVLRGDMSLIGPRPHDPSEVEKIDEVFYARFAMRPGLTGLWQVNARNDPSLPVRVRFDLLYLTQWSPLLDAKIVLKTVPVVLRGQGGSVMASRSASVISLARED